ncbi:DNA-binding protein [Paraburkholderia fungorum]|uniref:Chromosome segregation ATPase n=1 Tax=Paraburkholderia fungorum TaxID=134537 RepID=A0AAW3V4E5_9BURK|nr:DNA-binding protein [Paraburkholderia fungorum]MBB4517464.1 chromosome segregation ATPase [Paraburkholderia fungorum]MBB6204532.1 chromosome segregation ATPase [Paraburkholderia fungorum]
MARAGLSRMDIKRARDALLAQGQHPSIDAIRIALGNTGSKTTIHRFLKEIEEEDGVSLTRVGSLSDAIQDLVARLAARLHEEAQAVADQQLAAAAAQRQQAQAEIAKLAGDVEALRTQLTEAGAAVAREQAAHAGTQIALQQRALDVERLMQQVRDLDERLAEHDGFRQSLEEKLRHAHDALEHYRTASREPREQEARRHEQQVQQLQAELRQANQTLIVKQNEITQLNKDNARLVAEVGAATKGLREQQAHGDQLQTVLNRALADHARAEAERDALQAMTRSQAVELTQTREALELLTADRMKLSAQADAQQLLLADYRMRLGLAGAPG